MITHGEVKVQDGKRIAYIDYREYCAYPDFKIDDLLTQYGFDPKKPYSATYNQIMRRYEIVQEKR